jgi:hypothetical protein
VHIAIAPSEREQPCASRFEQTGILKGASA